MRAMVTVISWINRKVRSFSAKDLDEALGHLEIPVSRGEMIGREMGKLRGSLGRVMRQSRGR